MTEIAFHPAGRARPQAPPIIPACPVCQFCRRPIWQAADENGKVNYHHVVASFDMISDPHFHAADLFVPEKLMDVVRTYGKR